MKIDNNYTKLNILRLKADNQNNISTKSNLPTNNSDPSFGNGVDLFLRFLDTNLAWGANFVDLACMVFPRTLTDFSRGFDAGMETGRREGAGTANHSMIGVYGTLAGLLLAMGINKAYKFGETDIKAHKIFADSETMDMQSKLYTQVVHSNSKNPMREFLTQVLKNYEVSDGKGNWIRFKDADIEKAVKLFETEINADREKMTKNAAYNLRSILMSSVNGAENNYRIIAQAGEKEHTSRYSIDYLVENIYKLPKIFKQEKVQQTFEKTVDYTKNEFIRAMKHMNVKRSIAGIAVASAIGASAQPLNMYLTRKKTGNSGFVGGGGEDKSTKFKLLKTAISLAFLTFVISTITNLKEFAHNPASIIKHLQFKGFTPTIKQFKFIYGVTIASRLLSARNNNELRESSIKDPLGFINWLILGNFVQKLVALSLDKSLIKNNCKGVMKWIKESSLKSRDEVLHEALGEKVFKDGKALKFNELLKELPKNSPAVKQLRILTIAQIAGYLYSAIVLGRGIPKLNIYITNRVENKRKLKNQQEEHNLQTADTSSNFVKNNSQNLVNFGNN